jgi:hypothetical protein
MLTLLGWGIAATALLNLLAIVALLAAYAWNDWLQPRLELRRTRQRAFDRLLTQSGLPASSMRPDPSGTGEGWEW